MSDLGRLFRLTSVPQLEPLENFTTAALAIAIRHDHRPMQEALRKVDWTYRDEVGQTHVSTPAISAAEIVRITAEPQKPLWLGDRKMGYLDLVLGVSDVQDRKSQLWVEVKVDAGESGDQLANYRRHAAHEPPPAPAIITLGRIRVSDYFPALTWADIVDAVDGVERIAVDPPLHYAWVSLRDFLLEERIVQRPVPTGLLNKGDAERFIDVIVDVNGKIRELWPQSGTALAWAADGTLRQRLREWFQPNHELVAGGGPLRYGVTAAGDGLRWCLVLRSGRNDEKIPLDAEQVLHNATVAGLSPDWLRQPDRLDVLERGVPVAQLADHDQAVTWFAEGLRQLRDAMIFDRYVAEWKAKQTKAAELAKEGAATAETGQSRAEAT